MSKDIDILEIDIMIKSHINKEFEKIDDYKQILSDIQYSINEGKFTRTMIKNSLEERRNKLQEYIEDLTEQKSLNFYLMDTIQLIEEYKTMLNTPLKVNFIGKMKNNENYKMKLINKYLDVASKYINISIDKPLKNKICCFNCGNKKEFDIFNNITYVCNRCYSKQMIFKHNSSYNDIDRVNISNKYMYERKIHFRDCINQYQAKQNNTILPIVYEELEEEFRRHHLLVDSDDNKEKFKNITKKHIMIFLKELNYSKHYENVHLIHYNMTNIKPNDISHLEDKLLDDFDILIDLYEKEFKNITRKSFINTLYVLYQLLYRHKYNCDKEEFIILKTIDRKFFHDEVCKVLFEKLGWNFNPFY